MNNLILLVAFVLFLIVAQDSSAIKISIESKIDNGPWCSQSAIEPLTGQTVFLRVNKIQGASIQWFQIQPNINIRYNNAIWPWLPNAYQWKGFDHIEYSKILLHHFDEKWVIPVFPENVLIKNADSKSFNESNFGSFWFQAEVTKNGKIQKTPGIESKDYRGISNNVFRMSIKQGNDLIGNLTSYFNVPAVFGSTPYQVKNYIGIDCADVLMAAYYKSNNIPISKDYNVAMLTKKFKTVVKTQIIEGNPISKIKWQTDIRPGDFIAVKYSGSRQYQHIGALYSDDNENNILDKEDLILHAGPDPLHFSKIESGVFNGTVLILRPE